MTEPVSQAHAILTFDFRCRQCVSACSGAKGLRATRRRGSPKTVGRPGLSGQPVVATEELLHVVDQLGGSLEVGLGPYIWVDGHSGTSASACARCGEHRRRAGRVSGLIFTNIVLSLGLDVNESFLGPNNVGTFTFGVTWGRWSRPSALFQHRQPARHAVHASAGPAIRPGALVRRQKRMQTSAPCRFLSSSGNTRIAAVWRGDA